MMDAKLKEAWLLDLETAKQGTGQLYQHYTGGWCCLGRLAIVMGGKVEPYTSFASSHNIFAPSGEPMFDTDHPGMLSNRVLAEAGLSVSEADDLASLNDRSRDFTPVRAYIKENL